VVVNGTFFSFTDNRNLNLVIKNGKLTAYNITSIKGKNDSLFTYVTRSALGITKRRKADVAWLYTDSTRPYALAFENGPVHNLKGKTADPGWNFMKKKALETNSLRGYRWKMQSAIGGGPVLLHKGKVRITNSEEQMFVTDLNDKHPRTAMGYTADSRLIILLTEGRIPGKAEGMTLLQQATVLQQLGCVEALNLDGGGSSCMLVNGKQTITPSDKEGQRAVPAVFMIYAKRP
jgi:exopolysaccharide biosynthesis protein